MDCYVSRVTVDHISTRTVLRCVLVIVVALCRAVVKYVVESTCQL